MAFTTTATDAEGFYHDLADYTLRSYVQQGLVPPSLGVNKPAYDAPPTDAASFSDMTEGWFSQQRAIRGGASTDAIDTPVQNTYRERRYQFLSKEEGVRQWAYDDKTGQRILPGQATKGYATVGIGFNLDEPANEPVFQRALPGVDYEAVRTGQQPLNDAQIQRLFDVRVQQTEQQVAQRLQGVDLPEHQRLALVSMAYNRPASLDAVATALQSGGSDAATQALRDQPGPTGRRSREAQMFAGWVSPPVGQPAPLADASSAEPGTITDMTGAAVPGAGIMPEVKGMVVHHTGGRGDVNAVVNVFKQRGVASNFVIDRQGQTFQILPDGTAGQHIQAGWGAGEGLNNHNVEGVEIIAKDDADVLPIQQQAALALINARSQKWGYDPTTAVFGHGEVNPGHKQATEGMTVTNLVRKGAPATVATR